MKRFAAIIIILTLLTGIGCVAKLRSAPPDLPSAAPTPVQTEIFSFDAPIDNYLPKFTFAVFESDIPDYEFFPYKYTIKISCPELASYISQSIDVVSQVKWTEANREAYIYLTDIDFDGHADIRARVGEGTANVSYSFYRWNYFAGNGYGEFEKEPFFSLLTIGYALYPDTRQIISTARNSAVSYPREMYQLGKTLNGGLPGTYELIRREEDDFPDENGDIIARVFFGDEEIYSWNKSLNDEDDMRTADNCLRFGAADPIGLDEASELLYENFGKTFSLSTETGSITNPLSFMFEEMVVHDGLSCYNFRMQWLVDNNHWSTLTFYGVTPDGRIFESYDITNGGHQ